MQKHIQPNKDEWTQFFRKIYTSHFIRKFERVTKGFTVWKVSWRLNRTATYWSHPKLFWLQQLFFPFSWAAQPGAWGPSLRWDMVLIPASSLQLLWPSCRTGLYNNFRPPTSCERHICTQFNPSTVKVIPWNLRPDMHLLFTQVHFLFWQLGRGPICNNLTIFEWFYYNLISSNA